MKVHYTTPRGNLRFEIDAANPKEAVERLATVQEIFEVERCELCRSENIRFDHREFDGNDYYKYLCLDCRATLDLGQRKDGVNLFLKRKDADGNWIPNGGWYRYGENQHGENQHGDHQDHGHQDHGRQGHGRQEHGRQEHGRQEHGRQEHGRQEHPPERSQEQDPRRRVRNALETLGGRGDQERAALVEFVSDGRWRDERAVDDVDAFAAMCSDWWAKCRRQVKAETGHKPTAEQVQARIRREAEVHRLPR